MEVERLVQLAYPGEYYPLIVNFKTEVLVNGVHDPDIKLTVCSSQKTIFCTSLGKYKKYFYGNFLSADFCQNSKSK